MILDSCQCHICHCSIHPYGSASRVEGICGPCKAGEHSPELKPVKIVNSTLYGEFHAY
jgi:hypothetical protein